MKARINVITLAVADFDRALAFYRALGLQSPGVIATEHRGDDTHPAGAIVMFHLAGGQILISEGQGRRLVPSRAHFADGLSYLAFCQRDLTNVRQQFLKS